MTVSVITEAAAAELEHCKEELAAMVMASAAGLSKQEAEEEEEEAEAAPPPPPPVQPQAHHLCLPLEALDEGKEEEEQEAEAEGSPRAAERARGDSDRLDSATAAPAGMVVDSAAGRSGHRHKARLLACARTMRRLRAVLLLTTAVVALMVAGSFVCLTYRRQLLAAAEYVQAHAPVSAVWYGLATAGWILLCLPSTVIELVAGASFSWPVALLTLTVGKQLGCGLAFLLGRCLTSQALRDACLAPHASRDGEGDDGTARQQRRQQQQRHQQQHRHRPSQTVRAMFLALEHHPWQITFLVRLLPIPISLKNYGMSMLPFCPFHIFMATTLVAGLPFTACWVYLGSSCRNLLEALQGGTADGSNAGKGVKRRGAYFKQEVAMLTTGLVVAVALVVLLRRYTRRYTRLLAAREAAAEAAAAATAAMAAAATAADLEKGEHGEMSLRGGLERDVSTATTATSLTSLTLTPPSAGRLALVGRAMRDEDEDEEDGLEGFELVGLDDDVYGKEEGEEGSFFAGTPTLGGERGRERHRRRKQGQQQRRRRRSSEGSSGSCSTLSHDVFGSEDVMCDEETV